MVGILYRFKIHSDQKFFKNVQKLFSPSHFRSIPECCGCVCVVCMSVVCMSVVCMSVCGMHVCVWCICLCVVCMSVCGVYVCVWCIHIHTCAHEGTQRERDENSRVVSRECLLLRKF